MLTCNITYNFTLTVSLNLSLNLRPDVSTEKAVKTKNVEEMFEKKKMLKKKNL